MEININNKSYEVIITYKSIKNMYLRVKKDLKIYITCNRFVSKSIIKNFINSNIDSISKQLLQFENTIKELENKILYLGNKYNIKYIDKKGPILGTNVIFVGKSFNSYKWYLKEAKKVFLERLNYCYGLFNETIPFPSLKIRKMTSKWGVCNVKDINITLNLDLIKFDLKYIDYVIIHELTHLIHSNHSKSFWNVVEKYVPNYKKYRKEMKKLI